MEHSSNISSSAIAGATSGLISRVLVSPLDVIKIRSQNNPNAPGRHRNMSHQLRAIISQHGYSGLFRGNAWGLGIWILYGAVQFPAYELIKSQVGSEHNFLAGSLAASFATLLTFPLDAMRTRVITSNQSHARSLSRGLNSALIAVVPMAGLTFAMHERLMHVLHEPATSGLIAGMVGKTVFYPLDTVKRRLMTQGLLHAETNAVVPRYTSQWDCARKIYEKEGGIRAFFRGLKPAMLKTGLGSSCTFFVYETTLRYLNGMEREEKIKF